MTANNDANASTQPIAVVMGTSANPVAYMPANASNVVEGDSLDSDSSVVSPSPIAHITQQNLSPTLKALVDDIAPLTVPTFSGNAPLAALLTVLLLLSLPLLTTVHM